MRKKTVSKLLALTLLLGCLGFSLYIPNNNVSAAGGRYCNVDNDCGLEGVCYKRRCYL
jgi:hypothetical protein